MILKYIELKNIRSYTHEVIRFPEGSLLLSGNIGSGKSSILLSLEFALFGIMKGDIMGSELLRHGEKEGYVKVAFSLNKKEMVIQRSLKRTSSGISQTAGHLTIDGVKSDLVATELKARILKALGYNENLVSKSKTLLYRYTVYTPQEEMKRIISSKMEERLDILRSVFGIDRYKMIRENATIYGRELKRKISFGEGQVQDLHDLEKEAEEKSRLSHAIKNEIEKQKPVVDEWKKKAETKQEAISRIEKEMQKINEAKNKIEIIENNIVNKHENLKGHEGRLNDMTKEIEDLLKDTKDKKAVNKERLNEKIRLTNQKIEENSKKLDDINKNSGELEFQINEAKRISDKVLKLTRCPTCEQEVDSTHKQKIESENRIKIISSEKSLKELVRNQREIQEMKKLLLIKLQSFEDIKKSMEIMDIKIKLLEDRKKTSETMQKEIRSLSKEIEQLHKEKTVLQDLLKDSENIEETYLKEKHELHNISDNMKKEELALARLLEQEKSIDEIKEKLQKQVREKVEQRKKIVKMRKISFWLSEFFEDLMLSMEKHVMASIHHEFNELVQRWFLTLMGDEEIDIRLDNEFTPVLVQNGYETEISNLSGGEKTAVALAYRLALNKVINDMVSEINTKDILILDEPTDGFSESQLDRLRDVLSDLSLKQMIIVSHEQKIEGFVENVIRVEKDGHESRVIA